MISLLRNSWRALTSMRTALALLFLLAAAAVPGAVLPQKDLNLGKVDRYLKDHPQLGPWLDKFGFFGVFLSPWFTAVYALLFVSLVGCLTPRLIEQARQLRAPLTQAPRNFFRLPHHAELEAKSGDQARTAVLAALKGWRQELRETDAQVLTGVSQQAPVGVAPEPDSAARVFTDAQVLTGVSQQAPVGVAPEPDSAARVFTDAGGWELSAERGFLHEFGNLLFHFALLGILVSIAFGRLWGYEGSRIVLAGPEESGLCNTSTSVYDSFRGGVLEDGSGLDPFCVRVKDFTATFLESGQPDDFRSEIAYQLPQDLARGDWQDYQLKVNHPLRVDGVRVYLMGHGFAPTFTVTWPNGESRTETVVFTPQDAMTFLSGGAARFDPPAGMWPDPVDRARHGVALEGLFAPTAAFHGKLLTSISPVLTSPAVAVDVYEGEGGLDTGWPQSATSLDHRLIDQGKLTRQERANLRQGESVNLPSGVVVRFDGVREWVNLQVSKDPTQIGVLVFAVMMVVGLVASLLVRRRRVWARYVPGAGKLELGGLARTDHAGWHGEFDRLARRVDHDLRG